MTENLRALYKLAVVGGIGDGEPMGTVPTSGGWDRR